MSYLASGLPRLALGSSLSASEQQFALRAFVHRFTGDHTPDWVREARAKGQAYPVQFRDDRDWLANTRFVVTKGGQIDRRHDSCISTPTWPFGNVIAACEPAIAAPAIS